MFNKLMEKKTGFTPYTGPFDKQTGVKVNKKIISRLFNQTIVIGEGSARLRRGSQTGKILEEFEANSGKVYASGKELVLYPKKNLPYETEIFLTMDDGFVVAKKTGQKCDFLNETSKKTFSFTTEDPIGKSLDGGIILSKNGGRYLVVSPKKAEIKLFWEEREKAISHTQKITGTSGWFVPSKDLLLNKELISKELWVDEKNVYLTSDEFVGVDIKNLMPINILSNQLYNIRTFKFVNI